MIRDEQRAAFISRYLDPAVGLFVRAYADCRPQLAEKNDERIGRAMIQQMRDARELLGKMFDDLIPDPKTPRK
jgi:hypothetical protein